MSGNEKKILKQEPEPGSRVEGKPFVSIEALIGSKNPRLLKMLPSFLLRYLKRIIHEDELNDAMSRFSHLQGLDFIEAILGQFGVNIVVNGLENIPKDGRFIVASNHPLGGMDGMALMQTVGKVRNDIVFPVNDLLMNIPNLRCLFIPINKHGSNAENIQIMNETYASDKALLYFPAGLCSRMIKGHIIDLDWKKTFISKAKAFQRHVIPTYIEGRNSKFFYRLANFRKLLGVKVNIEMFFLIDEMFKQKGKSIHITFGSPIPYTMFDKSASDVQWASRLQQYVYQMKDNNGDFPELTRSL